MCKRVGDEQGPGDGPLLGSKEVMSSRQDVAGIWAMALNPSAGSISPSYFGSGSRELGIPGAGGCSTDWCVIGASSVKQLWKFAEKCKTSELLRRFGQMGRIVSAEEHRRRQNF